MTRTDMDLDTDAIVSGRSGVSPGQPRRIMTGDRFCTKCGYNLVGQEIVREQHYELLIVRCPECATVAGLQDYPRLGTWGARWGMVLAALWLILLLCVWPATSGIMLGFGIGIADEGSRGYARHLDKLQTTAQAQAAPNRLPKGTNIGADTDRCHTPVGTPDSRTAPTRDHYRPGNNDRARTRREIRIQGLRRLVGTAGSAGAARGRGRLVGRL